MNLAVIGTGYVGLVAGACFAETGNDVICVDIDKKKIALLSEGRVPIYEPGLEEMVRRNAAEQRLSFTLDLPMAVKNAANAMLATKISFINEVSRLCEGMGADVNEVRRAIGLDRRIGPHFIFPGVGYGGSCFPKDIRAMIGMGGEASDMLLLKAVEKVNERQKSLLSEKVKRHFGADLSGLKFAVWGLAFKPRTDDMREAPSITVIEELLKAGAEVQAFDPEANAEAKKLFGDRIRCASRNYEALEGAAALLILTEWNEFRRPNFRRIKQLLKNPVIFDGRNIYDAADLQKLGIKYYSIGRNHG